MCCGSAGKQENQHVSAIKDVIANADGQVNGDQGERKTIHFLTSSMEGGTGLLPQIG